METMPGPRTRRWEMVEWRKQDSPNIVAVRAYPWVDRVILLDESQGRLVVGEKKYSEFVNEEGWEESSRKLMG